MFNTPSQTTSATVNGATALGATFCVDFTQDVITFVEAIGIETGVATPRASESQLISVTSPDQLGNDNNYI